MEYRIYDDTYGMDNAWAELEHLVDSGDTDAKVAAAKFFTAMTKMKQDGRVYAATVPFSVVNGLRFVPGAVLKAREARGHHLYLTFIARPTAPTGEVRILKAVAEAMPTTGSASESEARHNVMTANLSSGSVSSGVRPTT